MNKILSRFRRDFILVIAGVQETILAIADHVNQSVQKVKINLASAELEKEIKDSQINLGKLIFAEQEAASEALKDGFPQKPVIKALIEKTEAGQKSLEAITAAVPPHEALNDFERLLIRSDFVIQQVLILDGFYGIGKKIKDLHLPDRMLIFFIKKNKKIEIAGGGVIIEARDEITFLCSKENRHKYIELWSKS